MGPKKVMKVMKTALGKAKTKAKPKSILKPTKGTALEKAKAKKKNDLNKTNLEKLGQMSLNDKIKAAAESGGTPEEQALVLKESLTKDEHSQVWGRHNTHLNKNPLEKEEMQGLSKKEKGVKAAEWLMKTAGKKYLHCSKEVSAAESLEKDNTWKSEKQMMDVFYEEEFLAHCASGRIIYRADPTTPNVWQYKDTQAWKGSVTVNRSKKWQQGHELEPNEDQQNEFNNLYYNESMGLGLENISSFGKGKGKGKLEGQGFGKGKKGKGFGKGKGQQQLALKDKEEDQDEGDEDGNDKPSEEELVKEALKRARKARDQLASVQSDLEEALGKASPKLSSKGKAAAQGWSMTISKNLVNLKAVLNGKKKMTSAGLKELLEEAGKTVKGAKDEKKELNQIANKEASVTSKRSRSSK